MYSKTAPVSFTQTIDFWNWKLVSAVLIVTILVSSLAIDRAGYVYSQTDTFLYLNEHLQVVPHWLWANITHLGDALVLVPLLSFLWLVAPRCWASMFGAIPLALFLSHLGKNFFAIPRPAAILDNDTFTIIGETLTAHTSFPSGHTTTVFTALAAIMFVVLKSKTISKRKQKFIAVALMACASLVAISRVAVGAHWPADLILGGVIGIVSGLSGEYLSSKYQRWWNWGRKHVLAKCSFILFFSVLLAYCVAVDKTALLPIVAFSISVSLFVVMRLSLRGLSR